MDAHSNIKNRKDDHLQIAAEADVEMNILTGLEKIQLVHQALPEIDFDSVDTSTHLLGKKLTFPLIISSMTGGTQNSGRINQNLALACQTAGVGMGVGSQRVAIEEPKVISSFQVRNVAPDILLFANLGAVQLNYGYGLKALESVISQISADALFLHLNPLQEAIQTEGNHNFQDLLAKIKNCAKDLSVPLIVKEVGNGLSQQVCQKLKENGIRIVDTAGAGGTSWAFIEATRRGNKHLANVFRSWGIPTVDSIKNAVSCGLETIGSGGIRTGVDIAKVIALGANCAGMALPFLAPGVQNYEQVVDKLKQLQLELKIAMFCVGVLTISELKGNRKVLSMI